MEMRSFVTVRGLTFKFQYNKAGFSGRQASVARNRPAISESWKRLKSVKESAEWIRFLLAWGGRRSVNDGWFTTARPAPGVSDVWQIKNLVESGMDSQEFADGAS